MKIQQYSYIFFQSNIWPDLRSSGVPVKSRPVCSIFRLSRLNVVGAPKGIFEKIYNSLQI